RRRQRTMRTALELVFWLSAGLIVWTQVGYAVALVLIARVLAPSAGPALRGTPRSPDRGGADHPDEHDPTVLPSLSLIIAAHDEEAVIAATVRNALALDYPRELFELIVACDGCGDGTAALARDAGADLVLELPRAGKIRAQDAAVGCARGEIVAFCDANALWDAGAARALVGAFEDPLVGYACGQVRFEQAAGNA